MINIAIGATYFIFCRRNKIWDSPDLITFYFIFVSFFCCFCLLVVATFVLIVVDLFINTTFNN